MKNMYWHRKTFPTYIIVILAMFAGFSLYCVQTFKTQVEFPYYKEKIKAAGLTLRSFGAIKELRKSLHISLDRKIDPTMSGLIGDKSSPYTTDAGSLYAKQTTINPNFSAIFVDWLANDLNLKKGDLVAVNTTGSMPALNIAMLSAIKELELAPLLTFSVGASNYGANIKNLQWSNMYKYLQKKKIFNYDPLGFSIGGSRETGYGLTKNAVEEMKSSIIDNGYHFIDSGAIKGESNTIIGINARYNLYKKASNGKVIRAFINVGGSMAAIGLKETKNAEFSRFKPKSYKAGIIYSLPIENIHTVSLAEKFLKFGVPVVNVRDIGRSFVGKYKLPARPSVAVEIGIGPEYGKAQYNKVLSWGFLVANIFVIGMAAFLSRKFQLVYKKSAS